MTLLQTLVQKVETAEEHLKADVEVVLSKAHAELDALFAHGKSVAAKDTAKAEAELKETEGEVSNEVKSIT